MSVKDDTDGQQDARNELESLLSVRFGESIPVPENLTGLEKLLGMAAHRSCRQYKKQSISDQLLRLLVAIAHSAPSKSDLQQADTIWVGDGTVRKSIETLLPSMPWISDAPVFLVICGNGRRLLETSKFHGYKFANQHLDHFFNTSVDAALVLQNLIVAAEVVGLGTCPISVIRNHASAVSDLLELPDHVFPVAGLCLGWSVNNEPRVVPRLPLKQIFHQDSFDESGLLDDLQTYDTRRGKLDGFDPEQEDFVGWSLSRSRMYAESQREDFGAFVRRKGYRLD